MEEFISIIESLNWKIWMPIMLITLLILCVVELFRSSELSRNEIIKSFVDTIDRNRLYRFIASSYDIESLKKEFAKKGSQYFSLTIRQAVGFAVSRKIDENNKVKVDIEYLDNLTGQQFEKFLCDFFEENGYMTMMTKASGDQGVDLFLYKGECKIAVQCKRYKESNKVGNTAIQEVITGKLFYDCTDAWVISTSTYTPHAIQLANKVNVKLIDRNGLIALINGKGIIL